MLNTMNEGDVFSAKTPGKAYFTAPAMVWPVSSDKWKAPLDFLVA